MWILSLFLLFSPHAHASMNDIFAELFGPPERKASSKASYSFRQHQSSVVQGTIDTVKLRQHSADLSIPISQDYDQKTKLLFNSSLDETHSATIFPNGRSMPGTLWNIEAGVSHTRNLEGDNTIAGSFMIGSPSNHPFSALRDTSLQGNLIYKIPENDNAWLLLLSFSNTRGFLNYIPLPGIAYSFKAAATLRVVAGIPFLSAFWTPFENTVVSFFYFPVYNSQLRVSYFLFGPAQIYFQAKYQSKNYFLTERADNKEKLFYDEAVLQGGVSMPLEKFVMSNLSVGYAFERKYFLGTKSSSWKDGQLRRLEKSPFVDLKLSFNF